MASEAGVPVELYIYDLTNGMASLLSPAIIGRQIEGVWHTSIVVYEREFFYGGSGVTSCAPGGTQLGPPHQTERLGETFVPFQVFVDYIQGLATTSYTPSAYRLLEHNCNHFSEEVAQFLCGAHVPKHIVNQQEHLLSPPQRLAVQALLDNLVPHSTQSVYANGVRHSRQDSPEYLTLNNQIEEARVQSAEREQRRSTLAEQLARKERKKQHAAGDHDPDGADMAEAVEALPREEEVSRAGPSSAAVAAAAELLAEPRAKPRDPPIVFNDVDGPREYERLARALEGAALGADERASLDELQQYLVLGEGSWVLGDEFLAFVGRLLNDETLSEEVRVATLSCLAACALRDDVSLLLHQDRRHHALLSYAHSIDARPLPEQRALARLMCNLFENISSSEWLLYISEWDSNGVPLSNIRATTKVCVHSCLSEDAELRDVGTALMYNVATKEVKTVVFDEVCVELAMALLQLLQCAPAEEHLYRACAALARLAAHSSEVPQLVAIVGPDPAAYRGTSPRIDEQIDLIMKRVK
ncbi:uncharacterized protein LOC114353093 isoform X2 [Ostrinia furnacalis]|uniref:uncharacterized protein LOC114353093 isoform X2 n=1 Tax=Ostrinia furnacalis TaxID=93504 RepID=UPI001038D762|nr:uncharacterized protein LOC114353093 isoform X2 [Ostrinia furnacalis]XP_028160725.1 uncharacterized protein LOC114353093 isoform X2 [Ostrinia furnacalis]